MGEDEEMIEEEPQQNHSQDQTGVHHSQPFAPTPYGVNSYGMEPDYDYRLLSPIRGKVGLPLRIVSSTVT